VLLAVALTLMVVAPGLMIRFTHVAAGWAALPFVAGVVLALLPSSAAMGRVNVHGPKDSLVTARTPTGTRTLDLRQLVQVRRYLVAGKQWTDNLLLIDALGVRLLLDDPAVDRAVRDALIRRQNSPDRFPALKASRFARGRLGLESLPAGYRRWRSVFAFLLATLVLPAALGVPVAAFLLIAKS
jgi:hypothetical protein